MKTKILNFGLAFAALNALMFAGVQPACAQQIITNIILSGGGGLPRVDPAENEIYLQANNETFVINGNTFSQTEVGSCWDVDVDVTNNNYWTVGQYSTYANVWSSVNSSLGSVSLGDCPIGISVDSPHRVVWVSAQCGSGNDPVWAVEADTYSVLAGPIGTGADGIGPVVVNPATDRLYINAANAGSERINPAAGYALTGNAFGIVMGANASANLLYAYANNASTLQIIDGAPNPEVVLTNVTLPFSGGSFIGVNPVLNHIYIGSSSSNLVAVLNASNGSLITIISLGAGIAGVGSIGVDASRNRVYVNASGGGNSYLYVIQDTAVTARWLGIGKLGNQAALYWLASATNVVLQTTTNLSSPNWMTVSNGTPIVGVTLTNNLPGAFFRLQ